MMYFGINFVILYVLKKLKMRKIFSLLFFTVFMIPKAVVSQTQSFVVSSAEITFEKLVHDFGNVFQGEKTEYAFKFTNTGGEPLILSEVRSSCGCTVPEWPRNPVFPMQSETVKVIYNSSIVGKINRQVTVISNANNSPTTLRIMGNVEKMPDVILPIQPETSVHGQNKP